MEEHIRYMKMALDEAKAAWDEDEVPVGAVLVLPDQDLVVPARNQTITLDDATAHAEILALRKAGKAIGNYRILNSVLYCTVEPCIMCMGAVIHARVAKVVYGAPDPKWGACGSLYNFAVNSGLNHHPDIVPGVCEDACRKIIQDFFRQKRLRS